jgi:hypothetical protein
MNERPDWMTKREVADYLRVSERTISRHPIPHVYVDRRPMYARFAVDRWMTSRTVAPGESYAIFRDRMRRDYLKQCH